MKKKTLTWIKKIIEIILWLFAISLFFIGFSRKLDAAYNLLLFAGAILIVAYIIFNAKFVQITNEVEYVELNGALYRVKK